MNHAKGRRDFGFVGGRSSARPVRGALRWSAFAAAGIDRPCLSCECSIGRRDRCATFGEPATASTRPGADRRARAPGARKRHPQTGPTKPAATRRKEKAVVTRSAAEVRILRQPSMRTTILIGALKRPAVSRICAVTVVSPDGKTSGSSIRPQNWMVLCPTKRKRPSGNIVQASSAVRPPATPLPSLNRQPRSLSASAMACEPVNIGGSIAGTPPRFGGVSSHTAVLPFPSCRDTTICRSGSEFGSAGFQLNVSDPTGVLAPPGRPSTTSENPDPKPRS